MTDQERSELVIELARFERIEEQQRSELEGLVKLAETLSTALVETVEFIRAISDALDGA